MAKIAGRFSGHQAGSPGSRKLCTDLMAELEGIITASYGRYRVFRVNRAKDWDSVEGPSRVFGFVGHHVSEAAIRVFPLGTRDEIQSAAHTLRVDSFVSPGRAVPKSEETWEARYPVVLFPHTPSEIAATANLLASVSYPKSK